MVLRDGDNSVHSPGSALTKINHPPVSPRFELDRDQLGSGSLTKAALSQ